MTSGLAEDKDLLSQEYREKTIEAKRSTRQDKRAYMDHLGEETQAAADSGDTRTVYKITKTLTGSFGNKSTVVKDKEGKTLNKEEDLLKRWAEHFQEILNRDDPEEETDIATEGPHQLVS